MRRRIWPQSTHHASEASVLLLSGEAFAQVRQVAQVAAVDVAQGAVVLLDGLGDLVLVVLDQRQLAASLGTQS